MVYLARWRMQLALAWLEAQETSIAEAAIRPGYRSEAAFKRAFRRYKGVSPGAVRRPELSDWFLRMTKRCRETARLYPVLCLVALPSGFPSAGERHSGKLS